MDKKLAMIETQLKDEPEKAWKLIHEMAGKTKSSGVGPIRTGSGDVTFNTAQKLRIFAEQYAILGKDEVPRGASYDLTTRAHFQSQVDSERQIPILTENTELNGEITVDEIENAISRQKDNACSPLDHITNSMLVAGGDAVTESLHLLFNMIFDSGMSPKQWQQGVTLLMNLSTARCYSPPIASSP